MRKSAVNKSVPGGKKKPAQRGKPHSEAVQAAVMAALLAGQLPPDVAAQHGIPERTIRDWRNSPKFAVLRREKRTEIEDQVMALLAANLKGLRNAIEVCTGTEYVERQPASEMATLIGVVSDKSFRLLEAISAADREPEED